LNIFVSLFATVVRCILYAMDFCLLVRVIMSWIPGDYGAIQDFIYSFTEPLLAFMRGIINKIPALRDFPIDLSFVFSYILLAVLLTVL